MHTDIDLDHCAILLRDITDAIAAAGPRQAVDATIPALIAQVRSVAADAGARLRAALSARYPHIGWRDEDDASFGDAGLHWVHDPVDGAYHYLQGLPLWAATLTLVQDGRAVAALVYDPARREMFGAAEGQGAWIGSRANALRTSPKSELQAAVVGTAVPPIVQVGAHEQQEALRLFGRVAPRVFVIRPMVAASLQLAYVAAGRLDAYWETGNDAADWLAGALLVREAGGGVTDLDGGGLAAHSRGIVAGSAVLAPMLRAVLAD